MEVEAKFSIIYLEEATVFLKSLPPKVRTKMEFIVNKSKYFMDKDTFKKLVGTDIWEFRLLFNGNSYRLLAFWDTETASLVLATNGFVKKTNKTPQNEIAKAERIRQEYFQSKTK